MPSKSRIRCSAQRLTRSVAVKVGEFHAVQPRREHRAFRFHGIVEAVVFGDQDLDVLLVRRIHRDGVLVVVAVQIIKDHGAFIVALLGIDHLIPVWGVVLDQLLYLSLISLRLGRREKLRAVQAQPAAARQHQTDCRRGDDTATYSKFLGIAVDHRNVAPDCYVTFPGSVVIDLKASYLRTLAVGKHTLRVIFTDGYVDTSFMITAAASTPAQPVTPVQPTPAAPHKPVPTPVEPTPAVPDKPVPAPVEPTPAAPDTGKSDSPRTGEGSFAAVWLMMSASLCAMFTAIRKRREEA